MQRGSTQDNLAQLLRVHGPLTAAELAEYLGISTTAVRQHLDRFRAEGLVEVADLRRGRGRPQQIFALTPTADDLFARQYEELALDLVDAISRLPEGCALIQRILDVRRRIWGERYGPMLSGRTLDERLALLTDLFDEKGNLAAYAAQPDGSYLLTKHHCTIGAVVNRYPIFCQDERVWLQEALQVPVEVLQSRATSDSICVFRIGPIPGKAWDVGVGSPGKGE